MFSQRQRNKSSFISPSQESRHNSCDHSRKQGNQPQILNNDSNDSQPDYIKRRFTANRNNLLNPQSQDNRQPEASPNNHSTWMNSREIKYGRPALQQRSPIKELELSRYSQRAKQSFNPQTPRVIFQDKSQSNLMRGPQKKQPNQQPQINNKSLLFQNRLTQEDIPPQKFFQPRRRFDHQQPSQFQQIQEPSQKENIQNNSNAQVDERQGRKVPKKMTRVEHQLRHNVEGLFFLFGNPNFTKTELLKSTRMFLQCQIQKLLGSSSKPITSRQFSTLQSQTLDQFSTSKYQQLITLFQVIGSVKEILFRIGENQLTSIKQENYDLVAKEIWEFILIYQGQRVREFSALFFSGIQDQQNPNAILTIEQLRRKMIDRIDHVQTSIKDEEYSWAAEKEWENALPGEDYWDFKLRIEHHKKIQEIPMQYPHRQQKSTKIVMLSRADKKPFSRMAIDSKGACRKKGSNMLDYKIIRRTEKAETFMTVPSFHLKDSKQEDTILMNYDIEWFYFERQNDSKPVYKHKVDTMFSVTMPDTFSGNKIYSMVREDMMKNDNRINSHTKITSSEIITTSTLRKFQLHMTIHHYLFDLPQLHKAEGQRVKECIYQNLCIENMFGMVKWLEQVDLRKANLKTDLKLGSKKVIFDAKELRKECEVMFKGKPGNMIDLKSQMAMDAARQNVKKLGGTLIEISKNPQFFVIRFGQSSFR